MAGSETRTAFPDQLLPVLARVNQQLMEGIDWEVITRLSDAQVVEEMRIASLALMRMARAYGTISDDDRMVIADTLARAFTERTERLFAGRTQMGHAEQVLAKAIELSRARSEA